MKDTDENAITRPYLRWILLALASLSTVGGQVSYNYPGYLRKN